MKISLDLKKIRADFPILDAQSIIYLDNAATTQKPSCVVDKVNEFDKYHYGTIRRASYRLCQLSTKSYEGARKKVADFIGAKSCDEIVFTSGTTQSINLVAYSFGEKFVHADDEIIISYMEHHANIIPWQVLCEKKGAKLKVIPLTPDGDLDMDAFEKLLNSRTKLVAITYVSNALGTVNPIDEIIQKAHQYGAKVLIDGAQSAPRLKIDVQKTDCDFFAFSSHKMYGPNGVGVLYGKFDLLKSMPPYVTGGEMIDYVKIDKTTFADPPTRFEAGTPAISQAIGLGEAVDYLNRLGWDLIQEYEDVLLKQSIEVLSEIPGFRIIGYPKKRVGVISFLFKDIHPHDVSSILDVDGICIRGGHHCAQPLMEYFNLVATSRISLSFYNTIDEIYSFRKSLIKAGDLFQ